MGNIYTCKMFSIIIYIYYAFRMLHAIFYFNCEHFLFCGLHIKQNFVVFQNLKIESCYGKFLKNNSSINLPWGHMRSCRKLDPIGSAVLTLIWYKQTNRHQTSKVYMICIDKDTDYRVTHNLWLSLPPQGEGKFFKCSLLFKTFFLLR